jgi:hypothetical protein
MKSFQLTKDHIKLLRSAWVGWDHGEFGAPAIDCKRPYGNSDVYHDIAEILDEPVHPDENGDLPDWFLKRADRLHQETRTALQIILATGEFKTGLYEASDYGRDWKFVSPLIKEEL